LHIIIKTTVVNKSWLCWFYHWNYSIDF